MQQLDTTPAPHLTTALNTTHHYMVRILPKAMELHRLHLHEPFCSHLLIPQDIFQTRVKEPIKSEVAVPWQLAVPGGRSHPVPWDKLED